MTSSWLQQHDNATVVIFRALQLGDMLCAVPALRALRTALPRARISLVGLPWADQFASRFRHYIDEFIAFPGHEAFPEQPVRRDRLHDFYAGMRARRFDMALQMHGSGQYSNAVVRAFGARAMGGFGSGTMAGVEAGAIPGLEVGAMPGFGSGTMAGVEAEAMPGLGAGAMPGFGSGTMAGVGAGAIPGLGAGARPGFGAGATGGFGAGAMAGPGAGAMSGCGAAAGGRNECLIPFPDTGAEPLRLLALTTGLGAPACGPQLEFPITEADERELEASGVTRGLAPGSYVCIHPGARSPDKCWPAARFAAVADQLAIKSRLTTVLTGSPTEAPLTAAVARLMQRAPVDAAGPLSIGAMAALMSRARLLVCNDTGVSHIAAGLKLRSVVIFSKADIRRWAPLDQQLHRCLWDPLGEQTQTVIDQVQSLLKSR